MNLSKNRNINGELITMQQGCEITNYGLNTVRKLAEESGTLVKFGRTCRIRRSDFLDYIYNKYSV